MSKASNSSQKSKDLYNKYLLALSQLEEALAEPVISNRDRAGVVQTFEFTYELAWKTLKQLLADMGHQVYFAREAFEKAFALGLLPESAPWPSMIQDRNLTSHVYSAKAATAIIERTQNQYLNAFRTLNTALERYIK